MRDSLFFFLNGQQLQISGRDAFSMLAPYLRGQRGLTGTKIACAHGACGSCSVLLGKPGADGFDYQPINACIFPVFACDGAHIFTVEGLNGPNHLGGQDDGFLSPVQNAMVECHGAQCGFCTPGMVVTLTALHSKKPQPTREMACAALEGNLCRCTGYTPILDAATSVNSAELPALAELYPAAPILRKLALATADAAEIRVAADELEAEQQLFVPRNLEDAIAWKAAHPEATVVAGATEVGVAMSVKGLVPREILSLAQVADLDEIAVEDGVLMLGARATWTQIAPQIEAIVPEFAALLARWGSPQLRNAGTVAGNIMRAASISDSLPFLLVCEARLEFVGESGTRHVEIAEFLENGAATYSSELLRCVLVPIPAQGQKLRLFKVSRRRAFDRSIVSAAFLLDAPEGTIENIKIACGGVAPSVLRLSATEAFLQGKSLETATWQEAGVVAQSEIQPASDAAASASYRTQLVANLLKKFGSELPKTVMDGHR